MQVTKSACLGQIHTKTSINIKFTKQLVVPFNGRNFSLKKKNRSIFNLQKH